MIDNETLPVYPVEGGIPVIVEGQCVGAIGVSGVLPHLDAAIADAGLKALDGSDLATLATGACEQRYDAE